MIAYPFGLDFLIGFIGCLRAGVIVCSVYPPNPTKDIIIEISKFNKFAEDAQAAYVLTTRSFRTILYSMKAIGKIPNWNYGLKWILTSSCKPNKTFMNIPVQDDTIAFIQYSSGSTGNPKGVMISHGALTKHLDILSTCQKQDKKV
jgi:acyl-CoA synthetase (AMP-forming)/AMP-acid ligase II